MREVVRKVEAARNSYESFRSPFVEFLKVGEEVDAGWGVTFFTDICSRYAWRNRMETADYYGDPWVLTVRTDHYDPRAGDPDKGWIKVNLTSLELGESVVFTLPPASSLSIEKMNELVKEYRSVFDFVPLAD